MSDIEFVEPTAEAGAAVEPATTDDSGDVGGVDPSGVAATPAWTADNPEYVDQLAERIAGRLGLYDDQGQQEQQAPQLDPFSDNFGEQLLGAFTQILDQRLAPITQREQAQEREQGRAQTIEQLKGMTDLGEFDHDQAFTRAQQLAGQLVDRFGTDDPRVVGPYLQGALRQAAQDQASFEKTVSDRAVAAYIERMKTATGGSTEPGVSSSADFRAKEADSYDEVNRRWTARAGAA